MITARNTRRWLALVGAAVSLMTLPGTRCRTLGEVIPTLKGHGRRVSSLAFLPDGDTLISAGLDDKTIRLWDVRARTQKRLIEEPHASGFISLSRDGQILASTASTWNVVLEPESIFGARCKSIVGRVTIRDLRTGTERALTNDDYKISAEPGQHLAGCDLLQVAISPDGRTLASKNFKRTVTLWQIASGKVVRTLTTLKNSRVDSGCMAFSPDGKILAWGGGYGVGGDSVAFRAIVGEVLMWDVETGRQIRRLKEHDGTVWSVEFSPDGKTLVSLTYEHIKLWDAETGKLKHTIDTSFNQQCAIAPNGKTFVSVGYDIIVWDMATAEEKMRIKDKHRTFHSVAFSPDGKTLAVGGEGIISLWNVEGDRLSEFGGSPRTERPQAKEEPRR